MVNIVDGEHSLLLRSSGSQALSNQDFSVDQYSWIICLQKLSVFASLPLCHCLCVFASLHFCLCVFASQLISFPGPHSCDPLNVLSPKFSPIVMECEHTLRISCLCLCIFFHMYLTYWWISFFFLGCHCPRPVPWVEYGVRTFRILPVCQSTRRS